MSKNIKVVRGNSTTVSLAIDTLDLVSSDTVYFTAKPAYDGDETDAAAVIIKDITGDAIIASQSGDNDVVFDLTPSETNVPAGKYVYDITIHIEEGNKRKQILDGKLVIKDSVTLRGIE